MSIDALPYMVFLVLIEMTVGGAIVTFAAQLRGLVTHGFLKFGAASTLLCALVALWSAFTLTGERVVGGYPIDTAFLAPTRIALLAVSLLLAVYTWAVWTQREPAGRIAGLVSSAAALAGLGLAAAIFRLPAWGYTGVLLSLLAGALSLGAVTLGMILGHWYLVSPRLPEQPLNEMTLALIAVLVVQSVLVAINLLVPAKLTPDPGAGSLVQNPAFWLRILVGLAFPLVLAWMAWRSSLIRGMMSATGLLYVATGAVLAGEALARGLQFTTAKPF